MTRPLFILGALAILTLAGCSTIDNPVTLTREYALMSSYGIALSAANAYRDACDRGSIARATCQPIVTRLRQADQVAEGALAAVDAARNAGDTVSYTNALLAAQDAVSAFSNVEAQYGVK